MGGRREGRRREGGEGERSSGRASADSEVLFLLSVHGPAGPLPPKQLRESLSERLPGRGRGGANTARPRKPAAAGEGEGRDLTPPCR